MTTQALVNIMHLYKRPLILCGFVFTLQN